MLVSSTPLTILDAIVARVGDVGFVEAGLLEAAQIVANSTLGLKVVLPQNHTGYPYQHSTNLYASSLISGQTRTDFRVRAKVSQALLSIGEASPTALDDDYYSFTTSGDYGTIRTVLTRQQFIDPKTNRCKVEGQLSSLVTCPPGFHEVQGGPDACRIAGVTCPAGYQCICNPCAADVAAKTVAGLSPAGFAGTVVAIVLSGALVLFVAIRLVIIRKPSVPIRACSWTRLPRSAGARTGSSCAAPTWDSLSR